MQLSHMRGGKQGLETVRSQATSSLCPTFCRSSVLPLQPDLVSPGLSAHSPCPFLHGHFLISHL